jgi:hypothetical protein
MAGRESCQRGASAAMAWQSFRRLMSSPLRIVITAALLAGCTREPIFPTYEQKAVVAEANIPPQNYQADILAFLRNYLNNPTGIRGAFIAEPELKSAGTGQRYGVCLRFNARKSDGQYEGSKDRIVFFLQGRLDTMVDAKAGQCMGAAFKPFPELERLTR